ncbi:cytoplasmic dynein 2 light intermediate chain 1-like isoform X2 [Lycorma delicatula]|uniref:cytoplasmic dynein 2 light intermediate chain 1-like isoform X2 n=1 Tax=Lycorma delicatula TaxID=130591 RepID=UPI003F51437E
MSVSKGNQSLRDVAITLNRQQLLMPPLESDAKERTLLVVGSKGSGKSTLIDKFLDRNEIEKPTLALEYSFGRKAGKSLVKDICHIWELGGGTLFTSLLSNEGGVLNSLKIKSMTVVMMLDLSSLSTLWTTLETLLNIIKTFLMQRKDSSTLINNVKKKIPSDHPDYLRMDPFPIPLIIIGGKYDLFQDFEPEKKRIVCRCLRYIAHTSCATLVFYSSKDAALVKRTRELLSHYAFGTTSVKTVSQDFNKPLLVPPGADLIESIQGLGSTNNSWTIDKYKHFFTSHFPQESSKTSVLPDDPGQDPNFREPLIDALRSQKDEHLHAVILRK